MNYYAIWFTSNPKIRGTNDYIKKYHLKIADGNLFWQEPRFIGNVHLEKIDFEPILLGIELYAKSKINDLLIPGGPIAHQLVISGKLKAILEQYRISGMQFFNVPVIKSDQLYDDFWLLNMYETDMDFIDVKASKVVLTKRNPDGLSYLEEVHFESLAEFMDELTGKDLEGKLRFENLKIKESVQEDFFLVRYVEGGNKYIVSEKLKATIEDSGCTGLEFQPIELSFNEWVVQDGEREKIYGRSW
ncbi:imm11 family protein [Sphingobacterium paucimobilis]|uniref:Immunity MXAN-0049 protein domain-containing protein n=1 Tax=Sphingobacterium paucimobilis HER1398 TaxID=1346330 RepID=U2J7R2_9SPHI|nr:DUF1629 domain-containing protein [Sphingobacterium paucimobilis]ERJ58688.1 hypothetical protein M472_07900 [Sphingobacterium paucimobilis HER1398]